MMTSAYPHRIVLGCANGGSESCIVGMPPEEAVIGAASLSGGVTELTLGSGLLIER